MSVMPEGQVWEMGLKAAAHEQQMAGWCIGMPCAHYVCGCQSVVCRVQVPSKGMTAMLAELRQS